MNRVRRLHFQLTPLLDLLLIVIFAQYMEVRETVQADPRAARSESIGRLRDTVAVLRAELEAAADAERDHAEIERLLRQRQVELERALEEAVAREERAGDVIAELFQVPEELFEQALAARGPEAVQRPPEEVAELRAEFRELARKRGRDVVKHILTHEELRKRCDIWELYIDTNGEIIFAASGRTHRFRATTADEFESRFYAVYKTLQEPKSLVVLLVSYREPRAVVRAAVFAGLPAAMDHMRSDRSGQTRFEYTVLGYDPTGEMKPGS